jgi:methyltransferase (TIGR00027 family)
MTKAAGKTGAGPTVTVAIEQHFPPGQRVLDDDLASGMLPGSMRAIVRMTKPASIRDWFVRSLEKPAPGIWGGIMVRKRYIDEKLAEAIGQVDAIVNLGAGLDTRLYRLPELADTPAWEVDQPENIEAKRRALSRLFPAAPANPTLVAIDFDREELGSSLVAAGYSADARTFFILEAVTQYLTAEGIEATFGFLSRAVPGSRLAFTYGLQSFLDGSDTFGQDELRRKYVDKEKLWLWGLDPDEVAAFLGRYGWHVLEHPTYEELALRYVEPTGRDLASTPIERMVYAGKL